MGCFMTTSDTKMTLGGMDLKFSLLVLYFNCAVVCRFFDALPVAAHPVTIKVRNVQGSDIELITPYLKEVKRRISYYWKPPAVREPLETRVYLGLNLDGSIMRCETEQHSGDDAFDEAAQEAIRNSAPFPTGPQCSVAVILTEIVFKNEGFPPSAPEHEYRAAAAAAAISPIRGIRPMTAPNAGQRNLREPSFDNEAASASPAGKYSPAFYELKGFKLLSAYQLKFIPDEQLTLYREKLEKWRSLTPQEKFDLR